MGLISPKEEGVDVVDVVDVVDGARTTSVDLPIIPSQVTGNTARKPSQPPGKLRG